jgi:hypothetical protein
VVTACETNNAAHDDAGADTADDRATTDADAAAVHAFPQVPNNGGPILTSPQLVTVTFTGYAYEADVVAFGSWVASSDWLTAVGAQYGVGLGAAVASVVLGDALPASVMSVDVEQLLRARIADGTLPTPPGASSDYVYVVYYPSTTKTYVDAFATSCTGWHGAFDLAVDGGTFEVPYATISTGCDYRPQGQSEQQDVEQEASHEIIEAATDPFPMTPAYVIGDPASPWHYLDGEIADLCVSKSIIDSGFQVQRVWSNVAAALGNADPCEPNPMNEPYVGTSAAVISLPAGQSTTITVEGWSSAPTPAWVVAAQPAYIQGDFSPFDFGAYDGGEPPVVMLTNGATTTVTLSVPSGTSSGSHGAMTMYSTLTGEDWSLTPILVDVP